MLLGRPFLYRLCAGEGVLRLNCGSSEPLEFEDHQWLPDAFFLGGEPRTVLPATLNTLQQPPLHAASPLPSSPPAPAWGSGGKSTGWTMYNTHRAFPPSGTGGCYGLPLVPQPYLVRLRFAPLVPPPCNPSSIQGTTTSVRKCMQSEAWPGGAAAAPGAAASVPGLGCDDNATLPAGEGWPWISIAVGGQQMEVVRMEQHRERVYRTEFLVDLTAEGGASGGPAHKMREAAVAEAAAVVAQASAGTGGQRGGAWEAAGAILAEREEDAALLTVCFRALRGTAYVSALEVMPVPGQLYRGVTAVGTLARRDQVAAGAGMVPVMLADDVAERRWHLKKTPRAVALQACSAAVAEDGRLTDTPEGVSGLEASSQKTLMHAPMVAMGYEIVRSPVFVSGGMAPPLFLPHSLLQAAFTPKPGHDRLHFEWHRKVVGRRNPWLLLLVLSEFNSSAQLGDRTFDILVNEEPVLSSFDILAVPGGRDLVQAQTRGALPGWSRALGVPGALPMSEEVQAMLRGDGGSRGDQVRGPSPRIVVITVWNWRPKFRQGLPVLELDLVQSSGSRLKPVLSVVEVFELVVPGGTSSQTELSAGDPSAVPSVPPGTVFDGANDTGGTHSNIIAAAVVGGVGAVLLVTVLLGLMLLWRHQERTRAIRAAQRRAAAAGTSAGGMPVAGGGGAGGGRGEGGALEDAPSEASSASQSLDLENPGGHSLDDAQGVPLAHGLPSSSLAPGRPRQTQEIEMDLEGR